ncbi:hypothetical protein LCGC14_0103110 [marine sediment metagenome]|uniref:Peptidase C39-like domain-containing protein n=1 Tax=marine sediment metagenome TaxID=412755 RepID=A0A0F9VCI3_9ZZZZ|nr:hypothetical protein [Candidatus Nealsonbacteria bacterium]
MKRVKINPPYIPLTQQKLCCVPCAIQWILLRRGLKLVDQETIGNALGLMVPKKHKNLFISKVKVGKKTPKRGWGTNETDGSKMNRFFKKHRIPLRAKKVFYSEIKDAAKLIIESLKKGNDLMPVTYMSIIEPKEKYGHALLISEIILSKKPKVIVGDPRFLSKKFWEVDLDRLIKGMSKKFDGEERGIYIFTKHKI